MQVLNSNGTVTLLQFSAPIIECIDLGCASNLMGVLICLIAAHFGIDTQNIVQKVHSLTSGQPVARF